jgi:hypothetical protein
MKKLTMLTLVALLASLFVGPTMQASSPTYSFNLNPQIQQWTALATQSASPDQAISIPRQQR